MSKDKLCIVSFGYTEVVMPMKAALALFDAMDSCHRLESQWDSITKSPFEIMQPLVVTLKAFSESDYALRKLQTQAWEDKKREAEQRQKETT